jgi:hypothetical protein
MFIVMCVRCLGVLINAFRQRIGLCNRAALRLVLCSNPPVCAVQLLRPAGSTHRQGLDYELPGVLHTPGAHQLHTIPKQTQQTPLVFHQHAITGMLQR